MNARRGKEHGTHALCWAGGPDGAPELIDIGLVPDGTNFIVSGGKSRQLFEVRAATGLGALK